MRYHLFFVYSSEQFNNKNSVASKKGNFSIKKYACIVRRTTWGRVQKLNLFIHTENAASKIISHVAWDLSDKIRDKASATDGKQNAWLNPSQNFYISFASIRKKRIRKLILILYQLCNIVTICSLYLLSVRNFIIDDWDGFSFLDKSVKQIYIF